MIKTQLHTLFWLGFLAYATPLSFLGSPPNKLLVPTS